MEQGNTGENPEQSCYRKAGGPAIIVSGLKDTAACAVLQRIHREWNATGDYGYITLRGRHDMPLFCIIFSKLCR